MAMDNRQTPAIGAIDETARVGIFINGQVAHVPLKGLVSAENLEALGFAVSAVTSLDTVTKDTTFTVKAGWAIQNIFVVNTTSNAVTLKLGTTSGGTDVIASWEIGANALSETFQSLDTFPLKRLFSTSGDQTIHVQSASWNSASLKIRILQTKLF